MTAEQKQQEPFHWRTGIAYKMRDQIVVRDYDLNDLTGNLDLSEMAYLVWRGELPGKSHARMLNAIMVCLAEHAFSPSSAADGDFRVNSSGLIGCTGVSSENRSSLRTANGIEVSRTSS